MVLLGRQVVNILNRGNQGQMFCNWNSQFFTLYKLQCVNYYNSVFVLKSSGYVFFVISLLLKKKFIMDFITLFKATRGTAVLKRSN